MSRQNIWEAISHVTSRRTASSQLYVWKSPGSRNPASCYKQAVGEHMKLKNLKCAASCQRSDSLSLNGDLRALRALREKKSKLSSWSFLIFTTPGRSWEKSRRLAAVFALYEIKRVRRTIPSVIPFSSSQTAYCLLNINWQAWASLHFDCFVFLFFFYFTYVYIIIQLTG